MSKNQGCNFYVISIATEVPESSGVLVQINVNILVRWLQVRTHNPFLHISNIQRPLTCIGIWQSQDFKEPGVKYLQIWGSE